MGRLDLRLDKGLGANIEIGIVASVRQIGDASGEYPEKPYVQDHVIPAGTIGGTPIELPNGTYQIDARLPSGEVISKTETLADSPQVTAVVFTPNASPGDWLNWQRLLGNVPSQDQYEDWLNRIVETASKAAAKATDLPIESVKIDPSLISKIAGALHSATITIKPVFDMILRRITFAHGSNELAAPDSDIAEPPLAVTHQPEQHAALNVAEFELLEWTDPTADAFWQGFGSKSGWAAFRFGAVAHTRCASHKRVERDIIALWTIDQIDRLRPTHGSMPRVAAVIRRGSNINVAMLPVPWPLTTGAPPSQIEIYCELYASRPVLTVRDSNLGTLLAYANNKNFREASMILQQADRTGLVEELIEEKHSNPLAACVAAYVGLATLSGSSEPPRWAPWLRNLSERFSWLPDGAVLHAAYMLQAANSTSDLEEALRTFKLAYRRGIPFYAAGLQHLMNGLFSFSNKDEEAKAMHEQVSRIALCLDPNQTFTVLTIPASNG
jgi:hypothetical protein